MCYFSGLESQLPGVSPLTIEQLEPTAKNQVPVEPSSEDSMVSEQSEKSTGTDVSWEHLEETDRNQTDFEQSGKCNFLYRFEFNIFRINVFIYCCLLFEWDPLVFILNIYQ